MYRNHPRNEKTGKLADRAVVGHLIGYSNFHLEYLIWDTAAGTSRVIDNRPDIYFAEIDKKLSVESSGVNVGDFYPTGYLL